MPPPATEPITFHAADGTPLAGALHGSGAGAPVLLAGALGVPQRWYAPFAAWLAERGHRVLTFDLRGMGASRQPRHRRSLRGLQVDLLGWARQDFAAAVLHLSHASGGAPVALIGHSLGLQHALMTDAATQARIALAVGVASGAGYWRDWAAPSRRRAPLMLHLAAPLLVPLLGWFPGRRLGMVADLPAGVAQQWSRWCRHPDFAWGAEPALLLPSLQAARFPIVAYSFSDDEAMTEHCTRRLLQAAPNAPSRLVRVAPADVGLARIGHLGAFKPAAAALWPLLLQGLA
jgi:predicted alpha/beta hydrolase